MNCRSATQYSIKRRLGRGSFGEVYLAEHSGANAAVKIVRKRLSAPRAFKEVECLSRLKHKNIIRMHRAVETKTHLVVEMEFFGGVELLEYLGEKGRLGEEEAKGIVVQILEGVTFMHCMGIIHRDLKLENILINAQGQVKIIDFGFSSFFNYEETKRTFCGSPFYASPEMVLGTEYIGPEVDYWSVGVILYAMLVGKLPFEDKDPQQLFGKIARGDFALPECLSGGAKKVIAKFLSLNQFERGHSFSPEVIQWLGEGHFYVPAHFSLPAYD